MSRRRQLLKRSECLIFFFEEGKLHCANYLTDVEVETAPLLICVLDILDRWRAPEQVEHLLPDYAPGSVRRTLRELVESTFVIEKSSPQARKERALAPWNAWGPESRYFHFATKGAFRQPLPPVDERWYSRRLLRQSPQPALVKKYARAPQVALRDPLPQFHSEFPSVLLARRTHRRFGRTVLSLGQLTMLLRLTWGVTGRLPWPGLGGLLLKTSPSGGARHPLEVYVWAQRVQGLPRGVYHYRCDAHRLEWLRGGASPARIARLCAGQDWVRDCAALFVMTSVFPRVMWRYRFSRAYRVVLLEAGHFGQTFCLVATWLGLAPFCTAALRDEEIEHELGLDGAAESVLYAVGVGSRRE